MFLLIQQVFDRVISIPALGVDQAGFLTTNCVMCLVCFDVRGSFNNAGVAAMMTSSSHLLDYNTTLLLSQVYLGTESMGVSTP